MNHYFRVFNTYAYTYMNINIYVNAYVKRTNCTLSKNFIANVSHMNTESTHFRLGIF